MFLLLLCLYARKLISCFLVINKIVPRHGLGLFPTVAKLEAQFLAWSRLVTVKNLPDNSQTESEDEHELGSISTTGILAVTFLFRKIREINYTDMRHTVPDRFLSILFTSVDEATLAMRF